MTEADLSDDRLGYCGNQVRRDDPERFLATLFAPPDLRDSLWAVLAFNLEVARTRERVREPLIGQIRLQWWRDAIAEIFDGTPREHAVVAALNAAVSRHTLSRATLEGLIDARETDLATDPPATLKDLETYAGLTAGAPLALCLQVLGVARPETLCQQIAAPLALSGLMLALPFRALHGRVDLPIEFLDEAKLVPQSIIEPSARVAVASQVKRVVEHAEALARNATRAANDLPAAARPALLILSLAKRNIARLKQAGFDPFNPILGQRDRFLSARLWWAMRSGRL